MHDLALAQIAQHILYIRVIRQDQQIFIGCACLLLCCDLIRATFFSEIPVNFNGDISCTGNSSADQDEINHGFDYFAAQVF